MTGALAVAQSGGPSAVINASLAGVIGAAQRAGFRRVLGLAHGLEGALSETLLDLTAETADNLALLAQTPGAALGSSRRRLAADDYARVLAVFRAHDIRAFAYIGGNGSMAVCAHIAAAAQAAGWPLRVGGVPKTIDNDLWGTDHAPGYGSAARFMALAARDTGRDLEAMATFDDLLILEALGRNAGWLAAAAALGRDADDDAPHLVYVPEIPFDAARFLDAAARVHSRLGYVFVVVGEGLRAADGAFVGQPASAEPRDALGRVLHSVGAGASSYLAGLARARFGWQARALRPSLIGRALSACVSPVDRAEAEQVGAAAAQRLAAGESGFMVTLERAPGVPYRCATGALPLAACAGREKLLPPEYMDAEGSMVTPAFVDYALPLIGGALPPLARLRGPLAPRRL
ncbi:MAG: pyrophosphate--fructose 6-phosphate 1-phosphotransferase [Chloroflexota bacterium]|nr:MAG: pyrophosphate--fructose 6-phosphate 1-phosphotransferase [Chloroflexota bacterium]